MSADDLLARLASHVTLEVHASGEIVACFADQALALGSFGTEVADRAKDLSAGLRLGYLRETTRDLGNELTRLVRRLASHGLLEYRLPAPTGGGDLVVIEPLVPDYWPRAPHVGEADIVALSRFAYLRRRGNDMVLESPRAGALFRICDPAIAASLASICNPRPVSELLLASPAAPELLALLLDCQILFKSDPAREGGPRWAEGDDDLVLWDFHDLLFHARSTEGRHANPLGGRYPYANLIAPLPAVRPRWPGEAIDLRDVARMAPEALSPGARLLRERHSVRSFDDRRPIKLAELSRFLDSTARVHSRWRDRIDQKSGPIIEYTVRPYPCAGSSYELELYLTVNNCEGLAAGFYHYDAGAHALVPIEVGTAEREAQLDAAEYAMGAPGPPQVLITIAARFGRVNWKYSSLAYELILKDVGVLTHGLYLIATEMGLGGCAIGSANTDLFARMTGLEFHVEGAVGQFALGRGQGAEPRR